MFIVLLLLGDLSVPEAGDVCALEHELLPALEKYCASAGPTEQASCRIVRSRLRSCSSNALESDDHVFLELHDERIRNGYCLHLNFVRQKKEFRLDSFTKATKSPCDCDCCP